MFVESTDFDVEPYNIPNLASVINSFNAYVATKEEEALRQLLGNLLYDAFIEGLDALPAVWAADQAYAIDVQVLYGVGIWKSLTADNDFIPEAGINWELVEESNPWVLLRDGNIYNTKYRWVGLKALLVPYIYSYWTGDAYDNNTGIGVVKAKGENSTVITPKRRIVAAYNSYSAIAGGCSQKLNTLYGYLSANEDLYADWEFIAPGRMNIFNI